MEDKENKFKKKLITSQISKEIIVNKCNKKGMKIKQHKI